MGIRIGQIKDVATDITEQNKIAKTQTIKEQLDTKELKVESILKNWDFSRAIEQNNNAWGWFGYYTYDAYNIIHEWGQVSNNHYVVNANGPPHYFLQQQFLVERDETTNPIVLHLSVKASSQISGYIKVQIVEKDVIGDTHNFIFGSGIHTTNEPDTEHELDLNIPNEYAGKVVLFQFQFDNNLQGDNYCSISEVRLTYPNSKYNNLQNILNKEEAGIIKVNDTDKARGFLGEKLEYTTFGNTTIPKTVAQITGKGFKKIQLDPRLTADYIVSNATELQLALDDISNTGIGGKIYLLKGTYDKKSAFNIPSVANIEITGRGTIIRPDNDHAIRNEGGSPWPLNLSINGLSFTGKQSGDYSYIYTTSDYTRGTKIKNCYFGNNNYDYISGKYKEIKIFNNTFENNHFNYGTPTIISGNYGTTGGAYNIIRNNLFLLFNQSTGINCINFNPGGNNRIYNLHIENNKINLSRSKLKEIDNIKTFFYFKDTNSEHAAQTISFKGNEISPYFEGYNDRTDYVVYMDVPYANISENSYMLASPSSTYDTNIFTNVVDDDDHYHVSHNIMIPKTV